VTEVARDVLKTKGFTRDHVGLLEMQMAILDAQLLAQAKFAHLPVQLYDRSAVDPIVYAALFAQSSEEAEERKKMMCGREGMEECLTRYRSQDSASATFVLLTPVTEWLVDDGVRSMDGHEQCAAMFREVMRELGIPFHEMGAEVKGLDERVQLVLKWAGVDGANTLTKL